MNAATSPLDHHARLIAAAEAARDNAIQQARTWAQEARTQRGIVLGILRELGLPEVDWNAERLVVEHVEKLELELRVLAAAANERIEALELPTYDESVIELTAAGVDVDALKKRGRALVDDLMAKRKSPAPAGEPELPSGQWTPCRKKPVVVHVREQVPGEADVHTREGLTPLLPTDLVMRGVDGELYPIARDIFARTYDIVDGSQPVVTLPAGWEAQRTPVLGQDGEYCWSAMRMSDAVEVWLYDDDEVEMDNVGATVLADEIVAVIAHLRARR